MEIIKTDFLVVGSGIAGLSYAIKTAKLLPERHITIISKSELKETNTRYAQGGIAVSYRTRFDSPEKHISDTLKAGDGLCNRQVVELVVKEGPKRLEELIGNGVKFDRKGGGTYDLALEGGHSASRVYHRRDYTGLEIERKLLAKVRKQKNISIIDHAAAIDLITDIDIPAQEKVKKNACYGAYVLLEKKQEIVAMISTVTVLATGGIGQVFEHTTNPGIATGDGIAMAHRAGAKIKDMAFVQFHPTALYDTSGDRDFLISEALRGFGAILRNAKGEAFMQYYNVEGNLATRDIVARAIKAELIKSSGEFVYLDCRHIPKKEMIKHFPTILTRCMTLNIDPSREMIPVVPSAHYCCGGIVTDVMGRTAIANLYACGECANTGLHGANRLASNSLLEALVFAHRCSVDSVKEIRSVKQPKVIYDPNIQYLPEQKVIEANELIKEIKRIMSASVGILTSDKKIKDGLRALKQLRNKVMDWPNDFINLPMNTAINLIETALLVLEDSAKRTKNAGVFYNKNRVITGPQARTAKVRDQADKNLVPV